MCYKDEGGGKIKTVLIWIIVTVVVALWTAGCFMITTEIDRKLGTIVVVILIWVAFSAIILQCKDTNWP